MGLVEDVGSGPVALDTAPIIYFIESHGWLAPIVEPLFEAIDAGRVQAVTSAVTLLEVMVVPLRRGDLPLAELYERLLTRSRGLTLREIDRGLLKAAAQLRAATRIKTPDALQMSAALAERCTAFVTNDRRLPSVPGLRVIQVESYLPSAGA